MKRRRFTPEFKQSIIEQLLNEAACPAEICRRYNISSGQLYTWKKQYANGQLDPEPSKEAKLAARVAELERLLGKVTMENEFLKKAIKEQPQTIAEKRKFITKNCTLVKSVQRGCELMQLAKRTYYYTPKHRLSETAPVSHIQDLCLQFPNYGNRRITKQLQREGMIINHKKVVRIMRENGLSYQKQKRNL